MEDGESLTHHGQDNGLVIHLHLDKFGGDEAALVLDLNIQVVRGNIRPKSVRTGKWGRWGWLHLLTQEGTAYPRLPPLPLYSSVSSAWTLSPSSVIFFHSMSLLHHHWYPKWSAGNGLEWAVHGLNKPILLPMCRPPWVLIVWVSGHQIWMVVWINLFRPRVCAAVSEGRTVGYPEPARKVVGNNCAPLRIACNVVWVAARFRYTSGVRYKDHGHAAVLGMQASYTELLEIGNTRGKLSAKNCLAKFV